MHMLSRYVQLSQSTWRHVVYNDDFTVQSGPQESLDTDHAGTHRHFSGCARLEKRFWEIAALRCSILSEAVLSFI
jgi:hypothetical protein